MTAPIHDGMTPARTTCLRPGCHHVLTRRQVAFGKGYCSRSCAARACWHDRPDVRRRRLQGMRRERTQRRVDLWAQPAWERLTRLVDVDALDRQVIGAIRLVLADAVLQAHRTGYRSGYQADELRRRRKREARRAATVRRVHGRAA